MTISVLLLIGMVVCFAAGISMLLERSLTRMVLGFLLVGNATNLLIFFMSGSFGVAPLYDPALAPEDYSDPLPQAFILTAIVITFGVTAFLLALIYRSWRLAQADTVQDDEEDIELRSIDVTMDDEPFAEEDSGDTEFGTSAEAAVSTASIDLAALEELEEAELLARERAEREREELEREERSRHESGGGVDGGRGDGGRGDGRDGGGDQGGGRA